VKTFFVGETKKKKMQKFEYNTELQTTGEKARLKIVMEYIQK